MPHRKKKFRASPAGRRWDNSGGLDRSPRTLSESDTIRGKLPESTSSENSDWVRVPSTPPDHGVVEKTEGIGMPLSDKKIHSSGTTSLPKIPERTCGLCCPRDRPKSLSHIRFCARMPAPLNTDRAIDSPSWEAHLKEDCDVVRTWDSSQLLRQSPPPDNLEHL